MIGTRPPRRLEAALYVLVAALLALVLLDRLERYAELAENAAVQTTVMNLQTALQVSFILAAARGGPAAVAEAWRGRNPIALAGAPPPNYLGERAGIDLRSVPGGSWLFDRGRGELVYVPRAAFPFGLPAAGRAVEPLRFALRVEGPPRSAAWLVRVVRVNR